jgi:hypothetical protein
MRLPSKNIFIDTNIYEENNFFHGTKLHSLFNYSKDGIVNLYMTSISKMELINRMKKNLISVKDEHNLLLRSFNKPKHRILKNLHQYDTLQLPQLKINDSLNELIKKLEINIKIANINIIESRFANIDKVFSLFYSEKPPFSPNETKRYEFPDAFILLSIEEWCKANKTRMIFLTKDRDFSNYKTSHLYFRSNLVELLERITKYYDSLRKNKLIPALQETLLKYQTEIIDLINQDISKFIILDSNFEKTSKLELSSVKYNKEKIISIRKDVAEVVYFTTVSYSYTIFPTTADLDKLTFEDNVKPKRISGQLEIPVDLEVNIYNKSDIKIKWINSNQIIRIEDK